MDKFENGLFFKNFSDDFILKEVIVGANSVISRKRVEDALGLYKDGVDTYKVRVAFRKFEITRNLNEKAWI